MQTFTLREEHIKLLRAAYISWEDCEFGAPAIDCKRPYGNSSVYPDIAEILGIEESGDEWPDGFTQRQIEMMNQLHEETETALQIILATGQFKTGKYIASSYGKDWRETD